MGFPIGSILVWETERDIESASQVGPIEVRPRPSGSTVSYLLDGQQRVSTLVGTLQLGDMREAIHSHVDWRVYFDLESSKFVRAPRERLPANYFPLASLLDTSEFLAAANKITTDSEEASKHWLHRADRLANAFRDYQLPLIRIREADLDSAVTVFARLNRTGRKISADQMVSALTYREGDFYLAEAMDDFQEKLLARGFGDFNRVFLLRAVLAALDRDIYASDWADLVVRQNIRSRLPEGFESASGGMICALDFLKNLGVVSDRLLPYGLQLVMLGEFYRICPSPEPRVVSLLERWFWVTSFSGWFGAVNPSKVRHALREIRELARDKVHSFTVVDLDEQSLPFPNRFDGRSARVRAFMLYLSSLNPLSVRPQGQELKKILVKQEAYTIGYVWKEPGGDRDGEFGSIPANRMFLDKGVSGNAFDALTDLNDYDLKEVLPSHGFPEASLSELRNNERQKFIRMRQENLIRGEKEFMEEKQVTLPPVDTGEIVADSDASDSAY